MQASVVISGTGRALPAACVTSATLDAQYGFATGTLAQRTGVVERYVSTSETQIDLAESACRAALATADAAPDTIDLVIGASAVPYQTIPSTAPLVMRALDIRDGQAAAFDVNSTCLSFLNGVNVARDMIASGVHRRALVFSAELASRALPWKDSPEVAALFGDGAAAVVLEAGSGDRTGVRAFHMRSYPSAYDASELAAGGTRFDYHTDPDAFEANSRFRMDGGQLFRITARHFGAFVQDTLKACDWTLDEVDLIVPHQASPAALEHMVRHTGFAPDKVMRICAMHGNQIAASIPFALDLAWREGRISAGSKVLMLGTSAGVSFGGLGYVA